MRKIAVLCFLATVLVAGPVVASNASFKLNYDLKKGGRNLISLPYLYYPDGNLNPSPWNSPACTPNNPGIDCESFQDVCDDLMTSVSCAGQITSITKFTRLAGKLSPTQFACGTTFGTPVVKPGDAYYVNVKKDCTADIVGSADDSYAVGKGGNNKISLYPGNNPVSLPYHLKAVDARDLCEHVLNDNGGQGLLVIVRIDPILGPYTFSCSSPFGAFPIVAGAGYFLVPKGIVAPATYDIQWRTY